MSYARAVPFHWIQSALYAMQISESSRSHRLSHFNDQRRATCSAVRLSVCLPTLYVNEASAATNRLQSSSNVFRLLNATACDNPCHRRVSVRKVAYSRKPSTMVRCRFPWARNFVTRCWSVSDKNSSRASKLNSSRNLN